MLKLNCDLAMNASWNKIRRPFFAVTALAGCAGALIFSAPTILARPAPAAVPHPITVPHSVLTPHQENTLRRMEAHRLRFQMRVSHIQAIQQARQAKAQAHSTKVDAQNKALSSGNVVAAAYAFRGTRYVMGGTSRGGFDCSGFVRYILSATGGVELPRTATEQYYNGAPIPSDQLQPGDLVFFKNTYKRGISHVGIYAGDGKFIHAANAHKGVRMDNLGDSYYQAHYAGARRVLPEQMRTAASL